MQRDYENRKSKLKSIKQIIGTENQKIKNAEIKKTYKYKNLLKTFKLSEIKTQKCKNKHKIETAIINNVKKSKS